jgi:hypothetical protein
MQTINWSLFPKKYLKRETHWYVSKIKTYADEF